MMRGDAQPLGLAGLPVWAQRHGRRRTLPPPDDWTTGEARQTRPAQGTPHLRVSGSDPVVTRMKGGQSPTTAADKKPGNRMEVRKDAWERGGVGTGGGGGQSRK